MSEESVLAELKERQEFGGSEDTVPGVVVKEARLLKGSRLVKAEVGGVERAEVGEVGEVDEVGGESLLKLVPSELGRSRVLKMPREVEDGVGEEVEVSEKVEIVEVGEG
ncbi:hypothetical protein TWF506_005484 [Arthrobotrys conoides]|uniref:Uncharacterized protein n=1 Tax=Arthrobotrys conoides TaxID=74498 RepID=A0AAN8S027_9PEZI